MFKVSDSFKWKVQFKYAQDGEFTDQAFKAKFKRLPLDKFAEKVGAIEEAPTTSEKVKGMQSLLSEVFLDFEEVEFDGDRDGVKRQLIEDTTVANALFDAYSEAISGIRAKNSETPLEQ